MVYNRHELISLFPGDYHYNDIWEIGELSRTDDFIFRPYLMLAIETPLGSYGAWLLDHHKIYSEFSISYIFSPLLSVSGRANLLVISGSSHIFSKRNRWLIGDSAWRELCRFHKRIDSRHNIAYGQTRLRADIYWYKALCDWECGMIFQEHTSTTKGFTSQPHRCQSLKFTAGSKIRGQYALLWYIN